MSLCSPRALVHLMGSVAFGKRQRPTTFDSMDAARGAQAIMATKVQGKLEADDVADTFTVWRKPGVCRLEVAVRGEGAVRCMVEALDPTDGTDPSSRPGWRTLEDSPPIPDGAGHQGIISVPEMELTPSTKSPYIQLRIRLLRVGVGPVEYDLQLEGD